MLRAGPTARTAGRRREAPILIEATPGLPTTRNGEIRCAMPARMRAGRERCKVLRAGDFFSGPRIGERSIAQGQEWPVGSTKGHGSRHRAMWQTTPTHQETTMQTPTASTSGPRHAIGLAAIIVLSIPGWLTALSPIGMAWAATGSHPAVPQHMVAGVHRGGRVGAA